MVLREKIEPHKHSQDYSIVQQSDNGGVQRIYRRQDGKYENLFVNISLVPMGFSRWMARSIELQSKKNGLTRVYSLFKNMILHKFGSSRPNQQQYLIISDRMIRRPLLPPRKHAEASQSLTQLRFNATMGQGPEISLQLTASPEKKSIMELSHTFIQKHYNQAPEEAQSLGVVSMFGMVETWSALEEQKRDWECTTQGSKWRDSPTASSQFGSGY